MDGVDVVNGVDGCVGVDGNGDAADPHRKSNNPILAPKGPRRLPAPFRESFPSSGKNARPNAGGQLCQNQGKIDPENDRRVIGVQGPPGLSGGDLGLGDVLDQVGCEPRLSLDLGGGLLDALAFLDQGPDLFDRYLVHYVVLVDILSVTPDVAF